jgi:hypothetical protein
MEYFSYIKQNSLIIYFKMSKKKRIIFIESLKKSILSRQLFLGFYGHGVSKSLQLVCNCNHVSKNHDLNIIFVPVSS